MLIDNYKVQEYRTFNNIHIKSQSLPKWYRNESFWLLLAPIDIHNELINISPVELKYLFDEQYNVAIKEAETLHQYKLLSTWALSDTKKQYTKYYFHRNQDWITTVYNKLALLKDSSQKKSRDNTILNVELYDEGDDDEEYPPTETLLSEIELKPKWEKVIWISIKSIRNITWYSPIVQMPWHQKPVTISWQEKLLNSDADFIVVDWSRQMGKSYTVSEMLIEQSFVPGADILVWAFLQKTTNAILNHMKRLMRNFSEDDFTIFKKEWYIYNNATGVSIHFRTLNDWWDNVLGLTTRMVVVDEAQKIHPDVWNDALLPTMTTTWYKVIMIGTAIEDTSSYMHQVIMEYKLGNKFNNENQFTCEVIPVTADDNPLIEPKILQAIHDNIDDPSIQRQYYNKWWKLWDSQFAIKTHSMSEMPTLKPDWYIIYGIDPARLKDRSSYCIMYAFWWVLVTLKSWEVPVNQKVSWETQAEFHIRQIESIKTKYKNIVTVIDVTWVGDWVVSVFRQKWLSITYEIRYVQWLTNIESSPNKFTVGKWYLISNTLDFIEMWTIITPKDTNKYLIEEFQYATTEENRFWQLTLKSTFFDDTINAFFLCLYISKKYQYHNRTSEENIKTNWFNDEINMYRQVKYTPPWRIF